MATALISLAVTRAPSRAAYKAISPLPAPSSKNDLFFSGSAVIYRNNNRVLKKKPGWNTAGGITNRMPLYVYVRVADRYFTSSGLYKRVVICLMACRNWL